MTDAPDAVDQRQLPEADREPFARLVVVGSSAGGVDALLTFVARFPADFPAPIVVAQHLDRRRAEPPRRDPFQPQRAACRTVSGDNSSSPASSMSSPPISTSRSTTTPISAATGCQPGAEALGRSPAGDRRPHLRGRADCRHPHRYGKRRRSRRPVGQSPWRNGHRPEPGHRNLSRHAAGGSALGGRHRRRPGGDRPPPERSRQRRLHHSRLDGDADLRAFLDRVRERTGLDFSAYKRPTIVRRLQRRMAAAGAVTCRTTAATSNGIPRSCSVWSPAS